jgi:hypothetical protein
MHINIDTLAYQIAQVRVVFTIAATAAGLLFGSTPPSEHLAYVEWFTPFRPNPDPIHGMYKVSRAYTGNSRYASIILVSRISQSIHLTPLIGDVIPRDLSSEMVLERCDNFLVNPFNVLESYVFLNNIH